MNEQEFSAPTGVCSIAVVESVEDIEYYEDVYDIEVEQNHNYVANGHLVHNCNRLVLEGLFGTVYQVTTTKRLQDQGSLAGLKIKSILLAYPEDVRKANKGMEYQEEIEFIVSHGGRNRFIRNLAVSCKGNTLVLFNFVEKHGEPLYQLIQQASGDRPVYFIHGGVNAAEREKIRNVLSAESVTLTFGSVHIKVLSSDDVMLSDGSFKKAGDITPDDDVCDRWIASKLKDL